MELQVQVCDFYYRLDMPQSGKLPVINLLKAENQHFAQIHVKFGVAEGHFDPLGPAKFHLSRCTGVGTWPQKWKISTFGKDSPHGGKSFDRFL